MKKSLKLILSFILILFTYSVNSVHGQVTTGAINGIVTSKSGEALIGAKVVANFSSTGTKYGTLTDKNGQYVLRNMKVGGPYVITVSYQGFRTVNRESIYVGLGDNIRIDFKDLIELSTEAKEIVVVSERDAIDRNKTGASTLIQQEQIRDLPTISRNLSDFTRLTPQLNNASGNNSVSGRGNRYNNIQIDGAVNNDLFGLGSNAGTPGGQTNASPISLDAIQEVQVILSPYDVRYGGFTGSVINAITKSGTNNLSVSGYYFGRNQSFVGNSPDTLKLPLNNFSEQQMGFTIGGPIIQDKAFFFVAGEFTTRNDVRDFVIGETGSRSWGAGILDTSIVENGVRLRLDNVGAAKKFTDILKNKYGYDPGTYQDFSLKQPNYKGFARFDFNIDDNNHLTVRHNSVFATRQVFFRQTPTQYYFPNSYYQFNSTTNATVAQLNSTFGKVYNELLVSLTFISDRRTTPGNTFPFVRVGTLSSPTNGLYAGTEQFSNGNRLDQRAIEITDNFTIPIGSHIVTFGTHNEFFNFENGFFPNYYGTYGFSNLNDFQNAQASSVDFTFARGALGTQPAAKFGVKQLGAYINDEWSVTPNFNITVGLRLDYISVPDSPNLNPFLDSTIALPTVDGAIRGRSFKDNKLSNVFLAPRIGFNYDITGRKESVLRGGFGLFAGRTPFVWISNNFGVDGATFIRANGNLSGNGRFFNPNANQQSQYDTLVTRGIVPAGYPRSEVDVFDPNLKFPQMLRTNLALDQKLPLGFTGTLEFIYSKTINDVLYKDLNLREDTTLSVNQTGIGGRPVYVNRANKGAVNNTNFSNIVYVTNTDQGYNYSLTAQIKRDLGELTGSFAYTYSSAKDVISLTNDQAFSALQGNPVQGNPNKPGLARSLYDIPSRILATLTYDKKYKIGGFDAETQLTLIYEGSSGRPFSYIYVGDVNNDGLTGGFGGSSNDLVYVPKDANDIYLGTIAGGNYVPDATGAQWSALNSFIESHDGLKDNRGSIVERNSGREPWRNRLDARLLQSFTLNNGHRLELTLDVFNVLNFINNDWGRIQTVTTDGGFALLQFQGRANDGKSVFRYNPTLTNGEPWSPSNLLSRWQMQFGARYAF